MTETLRCAAGNHEWTRHPKPGRKPTNCPDHQAVKITMDRAERLQKMQEGRERSQRERNKELIRGVLSKARDRGIKCRCKIKPNMTLMEINRLGGGCTMPGWCCPVLDRVRREIGH